MKFDESKKWHENNSFWKAMMPFCFSPKRMQLAIEEVQQILNLCPFPPKAKLLDLGCGIGRHSILLAKKGFQVTGIDRTPVYLKRARQMSRRKKVFVNFLQADMRDFCEPNFYDGVFSLYSSFGYFDDDREHIRVLKNTYLSLKKQGVLVMELQSQDAFRRFFRIRRQWEEQNGTYMLEEVNPSSDWKYSHNRRLLINGRKKTEVRFSVRLFSGEEIISFLKKAGFNKIRLFGGLSGTPYNNSARGLTVVAQKNKGNFSDCLSTLKGRKPR